MKIVRALRDKCNLFAYLADEIAAGANLAAPARTIAIAALKRPAPVLDWLRRRIALERAPRAQSAGGIDFWPTDPDPG